MGQVVDLNRYRIEREQDLTLGALDCETQGGYDPLDPEYSALPNYNRLAVDWLMFQADFCLHLSEMLLERVEKAKPVFIDLTEDWDEPEFDEPA